MQQIRHGCSIDAVDGADDADGTDNEDKAVDDEATPLDVFAFIQV